MPCITSSHVVSTEYQQIYCDEAIGTCYSTQECTSRYSAPYFLVNLNRHTSYVRLCPVRRRKCEEGKATRIIRLPAFNTSRTACSLVNQNIPTQNRIRSSSCSHRQRTQKRCAARSHRHRRPRHARRLPCRPARLAPPAPPADAPRLPGIWLCLVPPGLRPARLLASAARFAH